MRPGLLEGGGLLLRPCEHVVVVDGRRHAREALAPVLLVELKREFDGACEPLDVTVGGTDRASSGQRWVPFAGAARS